MWEGCGGGLCGRDVQEPGSVGGVSMEEECGKRVLRGLIVWEGCAGGLCGRSEHGRRV